MPPQHRPLSILNPLSRPLIPRRPFFFFHPPSTRHLAMNRSRNEPPRALTVPTARDVLPGARVLIVLKADQASGRQTPGVVRDVLTRGNHPRGIKVRLQDGRVGRVQSLDAGQEETAQVQVQRGGRDETVHGHVQRDGPRFMHTEDARERPEGPPERSLADFMVGLGPDGGERRGAASPSSSVSVVCPMCGAFEGDEAAVTHHIEREHLDE